MTFEELHREIQAALGRDLAQAGRLVARYARRAAASGDALRRGEARFHRAQLDQMRGRLRDAAKGYAAARAAFAGKKARKQLLQTEVNAVQVLSQLGRAEDTRSSMRRLRRLAEQPVQAAGAEVAIGSAWVALGDERAAETSYRRALGLVRGRRKPPVVEAIRTTARLNLGICLARRGDTTEAIRQLDGALAALVERGLEADAGVARHNRGWAYAVAGDAAAALPDLREAEAAYRKQGNATLAALARADEAELLLRLGDAGGAEARAREAAAVLRRTGASVDAARTDLIAARAARGAATRRLASRARAVFRDAGDEAGEARAAVLLGEDLAAAEKTLARKGHAVGALDALLARARRLPAREGARLLERRAKRYPPVLRRWVKPDLYRLRAEGDDARRIPLLRRAVRAAEDVRRRAPTGSLRAWVLAAHLEIYERLAAALLERGRAPDRREAFLVLDAARARTLREEMEREAPALLEQPGLKALRQRLEALWRALERGEDRGDGLRAFEGRLLRDVARCERELVEAIAAAEETSAGGDAGRELPEETCLAFAVVSGEVVGLLSRDGRVSAWRCGPLDRLHDDVAAFRFQVNRRLHGATDAAPALARLERLGERLLGPAPPEVRAPRLRIVVPPALGGVPVEALPRDGRPLLETSVVVHAPCACGAPSAWRREGEGLVVGIGSEDLPEVAKELRSVHRRLDRAALLEGPGATRAAILRALPGRRVVHLAGHARAREDQPLLSALRVRDGWLAAADLQDAALRRTLVVLSACRTGDPSLRFQGEALGGFPRAVIAAGAAGVVASRWEIPDDVAHDWMRAFYGHLREAPPPEALARAARAIRRQCPHPADWAAFLLVTGGRL